MARAADRMRAMRERRRARGLRELRPVGRLDESGVARLNIALAFAMGLAD